MFRITETEWAFSSDEECTLGYHFSADSKTAYKIEGIINTSTPATFALLFASADAYERWISEIVPN